ncbi:hypothetical protein PPO43_04140 [Saprospira sp. CCB-QB6]|uniref:hypothetical protein n=1 Tax=Saprospira sp. CCB-QB6 TaxID=3023936 RepID=UPI00234A1C5A|nr:hypothetical protein [Saprospira sp. CCB-QB6]WCL82292.1 hypothetical protein PPO43_04140 [Saprospira sp. CCB-QB6]
MYRFLFLPLFLLFLYQPAEAQLMNRLKNKAKAGVAGVKAQTEQAVDINSLPAEERRALYEKKGYQVVVGYLHWATEQGELAEEVTGAAKAMQHPSATYAELTSPLEDRKLLQYSELPESSDWVEAGDKLYAIVGLSGIIKNPETNKAFRYQELDKATVRKLLFEDESWILYLNRPGAEVMVIAAGAATVTKAQNLFEAESSLAKAKAVEAKINIRLEKEKAKELEELNAAAAKVQVPKKGAMDKNSNLRALSKKYLTELCEKDGTPLLYFHLESNDWTPYMNQRTSKPFYRWCKGAFVQKNKDGSCMLHGYTLKQRYVGGKYHTEIEFGGVIQGQVPYGSYISCDNIPK